MARRATKCIYGNYGGLYMTQLKFGGSCPYMQKQKNKNK